MAKSLIQFASTDRQREAVILIERFGSISKAHKKMGINKSSFHNLIARVQRAKRKSEIKEGKLTDDAHDTDSLSVDMSGDDGSIVYVGPKFESADELIEYVNVDKDLWDVVSVKINSWEVSGKRKMGLGPDGNPRPEQLWQRTNLQITVKLRRKAPKHIQDAIAGILSRAPTWRGKLHKPIHRKAGDHLLELSLYDSHFGKLCWGAETGTPYDLDIAYDDWVCAAADMLEMVKHYKIEQVRIPLGHDFFQVDNWHGTTYKGTFVDSTDDRKPKVFQKGYDAAQHVVMLCREVAPVEVIYVPGNHDTTTSWYLCEMLRRVFDGDKLVTVDVSPAKRKYRLYGPTLIGYDHGDTMSMNDMPLLMAAEVPEYWNKSRYRSWRLGHFHKKKETKWIDNDTVKGVDVKILPSLSGTDKWHFDNGFVCNVRAAEAALWSRETGPAGFFPVEARSASKARSA